MHFCSFLSMYCLYIGWLCLLNWWGRDFSYPQRIFHCDEFLGRRGDQYRQYRIWSETMLEYGFKTRSNTMYVHNIDVKHVECYVVFQYSSVFFVKWIQNWMRGTFWGSPCIFEHLVSFKSTKPLFLSQL